MEEIYSAIALLIVIFIYIVALQIILIYETQYINRVVISEQGIVKARKTRKNKYYLKVKCTMLRDDIEVIEQAWFTVDNTTYCYLQKGSIVYFKDNKIIRLE